MLEAKRNTSGLYYGIKGKLLADPPAPAGAVGVARQGFETSRADFEAISEKVWLRLPEILIERIAAEKLSAEQERAIRDWAMAADTSAPTQGRN